MNTKIMWGGVLFVAILAIVGWYYPHSAIITNNTTTAIGSPAGTNLNTSKVAEQVITVSTTTVFSVQNTDASDRTLSSADFFFTGGLSTSTDYSVVCATSSVSTGLGGNTNNVAAFTIAHGASIFGTTSGSGVAYNASSSPGIMGSSTPSTLQIAPYANTFARNWKSGSYLVCIGSGSGAVNGGLFDANLTGYIAFPYKGQ